MHSSVPPDERHHMARRHVAEDIMFCQVLLSLRPTFHTEPHLVERDLACAHRRAAGCVPTRQCLRLVLRVSANATLQHRLRAGIRPGSAPQSLGDESNL